MINNFEFRNLKSALYLIFPENNFKFINNEDVFKVQAEELVIYSLDGKWFTVSSIENNDGTYEQFYSRGTNIWEMADLFCQKIFSKKIKTIFENTSMLENF